MNSGLPQDRLVQAQAPRVSAVLAIIVAGVVVLSLRSAIVALAITAGQAPSSALPIETPIPFSAGMLRVAHAMMLSPTPAKSLSEKTAVLTTKAPHLPLRCRAAAVQGRHQGFQGFSSCLGVPALAVQRRGLVVGFQTVSKPTPIASPAAMPPFFGAPERIGSSAQGRPIVVYRLGAGPVKRALIGAIHGGYEGNTAALMTKTLEYLRDNPDLIPPQLTLYILPIANPDGYAAGDDRVVARMNGNGVDLNRNWGYQWQMTATHGTRPVSAGRRAFSEPETRAMRDFIFGREIEAVIVFHSAYGAVFHGAEMTTSKTVELARLIARATGYRLAPEGVPGQVTTGNAIDYLSLNGIDAIEVELTAHDDLDWERNRRGLLAFLTWNLPRSLNRNFDICRWRDQCDR